MYYLISASCLLLSSLILSGYWHNLGKQDLNNLPHPNPFQHYIEENKTKQTKPPNETKQTQLP